MPAHGDCLYRSFQAAWQQRHPQLNSGAEPDADISAAGAPARTLVAASREDLETAAAVEQLVGR